MKGILAIETATEACSVALWREGELLERHEVTPRQHSQRLFSMLRELIPDGRLRDHGVDALAYGCGPGSFTGLRVAASAVQGLAYASGLPAVAISTLACQAQTAVRTGVVGEDDIVASAIDARINEIYWCVYLVKNGLVSALGSPQACPPSAVVAASPFLPTVAVGSGARFAEAYPREIRRALGRVDTELLPHASDLIPLAIAAAEAGELQSAMQVSPLYVRDEIHWKKIPEQGKRT